MDEIYYQIGYGVAAGAAIAVAGYLKSYKPTGEHESFDVVAFVKTAVLGAIVGGVSGGTGMAAEVIVSLPYYAGVTVVVENVLKAIYRHFTVSKK